MRILVVGDLHLKFELSYSSAIKDGRREEWDNVKETIHDASKTCDAVVLLGDTFNARHNHSSVIREFVDFLNGFGDKEVHILVGNHERFGTATALDFLKNIKHRKWLVYTEPTQTTITFISGQSVMMVPFMTPALLGVETKEEGLKKIIKSFPKEKCPLAFCHQMIGGGKFNNLPVEMMNEIILPQKDMEKHFDHTFAGHLHNKQMISPNIYMTGNIFTQEMGECDKSVWIYEKSKIGKVKIEEVPLPTRGIYKLQLDQVTLPDLMKIPSNSIVKCIVTNREISIDMVKKALKRFDANIVIEQYPSERSKVHFEDGGLDLGVDNLLKLYAEAKKIVYEDLKTGFELIKQ